MRRLIFVVTAVLGGAMLMTRAPFSPESADAASIVNADDSQPATNTATASPAGQQAAATGQMVARPDMATNPPAVSGNAVAAGADDGMTVAQHGLSSGGSGRATISEYRAAVTPHTSRESTHAENSHPDVESHATEAGVKEGMPQTPAAGATGTSGFVATPLVTPVPSGGGGGVPASRG